MTRLYDAADQWIVDRVQVNIPFSWLAKDKWYNAFIDNRLNPEIGIDADALDRFGPAEFADIAEKFQSLDRTITLHGPFLDLSPGSPDAAIRDVTRRRLEQTVAAAAVFSPETVVCHAGYDKYRYEFIRETWLQRAAETWEKTGEALARHNCRLMLENVYETGPEQLQWLFSRLNTDNIGCCLDIGHLHVFGHQDLSAWISTLAPHIGQVHLHDNDGNTDQHLGLGRGTIFIEAIAALFDPARPRPVVTLEPHEKSDLTASIQYLRNVKWFR
ncbi:MAG: sugar phosphate isomerase/epimerase family protein [Thermodesulfobacteriota bacterium]